ncbi:MAG: glycosyltransferase [Acidobacteriota bacterium]
MTRVFILGASPLPTEPGERQYAANLRTWHFTKPLLDAGHEVCLVGCRVPAAYPDDAPPRLESRDRSLRYWSLEPALFHDRSAIQELFDEFEADAVLGVNTYPSSRAVHIDTEMPIWCDLNGWIMAEAQTKSHVYADDDYISHFWKLEKAILERADMISTVSRAQAHATIGELAALGRLGKDTFGYRFTHPIPNAVVGVDYAHHRTVIRGKVVPDDAFVVLWVGGYNTWTDVELLDHALVEAMDRVPNLHYVSTGGALEGHDDITFRRFRERADSGPYADRVHFVGWVPTEDVPCYYFESDLGINVDSANYETVFGARNRLNEFLKVGLPVLTTLGTEISYDIEEHDLGLTCPIGDAERFAAHLIAAAEDRERLRRMAARAQDFALNEYSYEATTRPMVEWMKAPRRAPDLGRAVALRDIDFFRADPYTPDDAAAEDETPDDETPDDETHRAAEFLDETETPDDAALEGTEPPADSGRDAEASPSATEPVPSADGAQTKPPQPVGPGRGAEHPADYAAYSELGTLGRIALHALRPFVPGKIRRRLRRVIHVLTH